MLGQWKLFKDQKNLVSSMSIVPLQERDTKSRIIYSRIATHNRAGLKPLGREYMTRSLTCSPVFSSFHVFAHGQSNTPGVLILVVRALVLDAAAAAATFWA